MKRPTVSTLERLLSLIIATFPKATLTHGATILVYHGIVDDAAEGYFPEDSVRVQNFERQMRFLREQSFNVVPLGKILSYLENKETIPAKTVAITFDDGYRDTYTNAFPIMKRYNIPATIFLAASFIGQQRPFPWLVPIHQVSPDARYPLNWEQVRELRAEGIDMGSHTFTHCFLPGMNKGRIFHEIKKSQDCIKKNLDEDTNLFALPYSFPMTHHNWPSFQKELIEVLKERAFRCCATMLRGHIAVQDNPFTLNRIPVGKYDDISMYQAKLRGCYAWSRIPQKIYQYLFKKYGSINII